MNAPRRSRPRNAADDQHASRAATAESATLRDRILEAAVSSLIEQGTAQTTTLEVQRRAGVSRGALLHHFPTLAQLLSATVGELVRRNEASVQESLLKLAGANDPVERAIRVLAVATAQPAYLAELELWVVARTDPELHASLLEAEKRARKESERVLKSLFPASNGQPAQAAVVAMTLEFLRGLAVSGVLRSSPVRRHQLIAQWIRATKILLETMR